MDRRQQRTRDAIRNAFIGLATNRRYDDFSVRDLIDAAGIGKSTFYEHYRSKDDVLHTLMDGMLAELADAATGAAAPERLRGLLAHFWENRRLGKTTFGPPLAPTVRRRLAELIEQRQRSDRVYAAYTAAGVVGLLHAWLSGEVSADVAEIAAGLSEPGAAR
jgi:AcrR family transcriptional regulator